MAYSTVEVEHMSGMAKKMSDVYAQHQTPKSANDRR